MKWSYSAKHWVLLLGFVLVSGCQTDSSSESQTQDNIFLDQYGFLHICTQDTLDSNIAVSFSFFDNVVFEDTDILSLDLIEYNETDFSFSLLRTECIHTFETSPLSYTFTYDASKIDESKEYFMSARLYRNNTNITTDDDSDLISIKLHHNDLGTPYEEIYHGGTQVLTNGFGNEINITLSPISP